MVLVSTRMALLTELGAVRERDGRIVKSKLRHSHNSFWAWGLSNFSL